MFCSRRGRKKTKMAKNNDSLSGFLKNPSRVNGQSASKLLAVTNLVTGSDAGRAGSSGTLRAPGAQSGLPAFSLTSKVSLTGIKFGNAPGSAVTSAGTGNQWTNLLNQAASGGGINSLLGGSLQGLGGVGSIISGIVNLFGGNKSVPALTAFRLPDSQEHVASVRAGADTSVSTGSTSKSVSASGIYGSPTTTSPSSSPNVDAQWFMDNSNNIAQAVKSAILNSSSLNDVVSEV